jgi:hypothetical protein
MICQGKGQPQRAPDGLSKSFIYQRLEQTPQEGGFFY